ncbi:HAD family hydrolase [Altericroceibacterium endophyticum]|uniref:HAD family hydrolase n=1 Tax=Altericroceibacterium endophyticum TaxID=1808508 RepID=A0A6I4T3N3_9SPHN|nr:HAD family hydrolase [Altericroceibacterium endophyticum]MXO65476.1 HAD family hydrolase [Altericroceibacterium endophyticum]
MTRPLVITDCDEVLLHMVQHFRQWLDEDHAIDFQLRGRPFVQSMTRADGEALTEKEIFSYLDRFFDTEMHRQTPIAGAVNAINELRQDADVVVLTNLGDKHNAARKQQLRDHGIDAPVFTNQGPKGEALKRIVEEYGAQRAVFIDDLAVHHKSASEVAPHITRLHFCGEPAIAPHVPCALEAGHAHARIDNWADALPWLRQTLHGEESK